MITEDYVSFETSKLLNENGFNEYTLMVYSQNGSFMPNGAIEDTYQVFYPAPTLQMAIKWIREEKGIFIEAAALSQKSYVYRVALVGDDEEILYEDYACEEGERFISYQEAFEFAIDYVFNNLLTEE